jgi:hypothetical protein
MPMRGELPPISVRPHSRWATAQLGWSRILAVISNPDFQYVLIFCAIGLLLTINAMLHFPGFGGEFAELSVIP